MDLSRLVCPACKHHYEMDQISVIGSYGSELLIRATCGCALVTAFLITTQIRLSPISFEDVLIAHEFLKTYAGDIHGLFTPPPPLPPLPLGPGTEAGPGL